MKLRQKAVFSILAFLLIIFLIYLSQAILTPFIFSLAVAYFLNPVVNRFQQKNNRSRLHSTILIFSLFFSLFISISLIILPTIYTQTIALIEALPGYVKVFSTSFYPKIVAFANNAGIDLGQDLSSLTAKENVAPSLVGLSGNIIENAINSSVVVLNIISLLFITPFLIFYLLKDWEVMLQKINQYLPQEESSLLRKVLREMDQTLSGYVRGQINVCLILGFLYAILLSLAGLNFGFMIGFATGILSFVPYVGMLIGVIAATVVGLFQWGVDAHHIAIITSIFIFGQIVEGNFLTPKMIGSQVGLHPVWLIFGLFFFGDLLGFIGLLIAIPLTAMCGVVVKNLAYEYKRRFDNGS